MSLTEQIVLDQTEIVHRTGHVQVRMAKQIIRDAGTPQEEIVATEYWRGVIDPGDTAKADALGVRTIADAAWTEEIIAAYRSAAQGDPT